ncbi:MAG: DUF6069 family protein [Kineosporiaceae bacterium]|jgi:hypothetical protein
MSTRTTGTTATRADRPSLLRAAGVTAAVAVVVNLVVYLVGRAVAGPLTVTQAGSDLDVPVVAPIAATVVGVAVGAVALLVLRRFAGGLTIWTVLAVVVGLGSITQPVLAGTDTGTDVTLGLMHVVVLGAALAFLRPAGRPA